MTTGVEILQGECREVMATLEPGSVNCVVTSPPYWGLRDYGTATWVGGDESCDHVTGRAGRTVTASSAKQTRGECPRCGAVRQDRQLGLEPTPEEYVETMVAVFREVRRVLRDDGTVWLNLGDSYNAYNGGAGPGSTLSKTLKPKDLVGIPWMVAFALRADGWYLRSDIIWSKPNPMPESVQDRPTRSHEYVFLLTKSARYCYDAAAIAEPALNEGVTVRTNGNDGMDAGYDGNRTRDAFRRGVTVGATRNKRSVWEIAPQPFKDAHFATFPEALVKPCILAGCPEGGTVLDPFGGSGTVGVVARKAGRRAILIELNPDYVEMMRARMQQGMLM